MIGASVADIRLSGSVTVKGTNAPVPYDMSKLPSYVNGNIKAVSDAEFEVLLGHKIPDGSWVAGQLQMNDAICQLYYAKSWPACQVYKIMTNMLNKSMEKGKPDMNIIFSYVVTFIKMLLLMFLPTLYHGIVGDTEWLFPGIPVSLFGVNFNLAIIGNALETGSDGAFLVNSGLAFTLANLTAIFFGECINFPLQRNVIFKSHGPLPPQILCHLIATIVVFLVMNLFTCIWNPVTVALIANEGLRNTVSSIVTTVVTGGVSMVIIFLVYKKIFAPGFGDKKN